jgi:lipopolysaccharide transport protein LptA
VRLLAALLLPMLSAPVKTPPGPAVPANPIRWEAAKMRMESRAHHVFLDGDVRISRTDLLVLGDKAVADLADHDAAAPVDSNPKKKGKARSEPVAIPGLGATVERFTIDGAVHIEHANRTADGDHSIYDAAAQTLTLEGPAKPSQKLPAGSPLPVLSDAKETLAGEKILMRLDNDEIEVEKPQLILLRSQAPGSGPASSAAPIPARVEAKSLTVDQDRHRMRFRDQVVLHRADLTVAGPRMDARSGGDGEIDQLAMTGGVQLRQGQRRATAKNATYDAKARTVILTGNPRLFDRGDELRGDRIELSLDTDEVRVDRVNARMHAEAHAGEETGPKKSAAPAKPVTP